MFANSNNFPQEMPQEEATPAMGHTYCLVFPEEKTPNSAKCPNISQEQGILPAKGLLGAAYVPEQRMSSPQYTKEDALKNGTLFPGLNLPYGDYCPTTDVANTPKGEMMALSFAIAELGLYLDTHPRDGKALRLRNNFIKTYEQVKEKFECKQGPITSETVMENGYTWLDSPWPWEKGC